MSGAMNGKVAVSSTIGSIATTAFNGNGVGVVMPVGSAYGSVRICVDPGRTGGSCKTVDLSVLPAGNRRLVAAFTGLTNGAHWLRVAVVGGQAALDGALISHSGVPAT
jgi:hypothetical protein